MRLYSKSVWIWRRMFHQQINNSLTSDWKKSHGFPTNILIYSPIKKCKVPLFLQNKNIAKWYMCGPTVYDTSHIGHACSYVRFDIIRRIFEEFFDIKVLAVMGITDIDDKIINRAQGSTQFSDWKHLAKHYEQQFYEHMISLNVLPPYLYCRVSDYLPQIIRYIEKIMEKNYAYIGKDGSIYFDTQKYNKYNKFGRCGEHEPHPIKKSNHDFALWKAAKEGEPSWNSSWGPGRPGWHIECSTMGSITLGNAIDLHSGGLDLMFPHHENEEAQSCCYHETDQWVKYWIHSGLLNLEDVKMSKSLSNTISITELLEKYTANEFRLLCLLTHYRSHIDFSHDKMKKSIALLKKFNYFHSDCLNCITGNMFPGSDINADLIYDKLNSAQENIYSALCDDFATPRVIAELSNLVDEINKMINVTQQSPTNDTKNINPINTVCICTVSIYVSRILTLLGITQSSIEKNADDRKFYEVIDNFVKFRSILRNKSLSKEEIKKDELLIMCDEIRKTLGACGIKIKDVKNDISTWVMSEN